MPSADANSVFPLCPICAWAIDSLGPYKSHAEKTESRDRADQPPKELGPDELRALDEMGKQLEVALGLRLPDHLDKLGRQLEVALGIKLPADDKSEPPTAE